MVACAGAGGHDPRRRTVEEVVAKEGAGTGPGFGAEGARPSAWGWAILVALLALAGGLRFWRLGDWPFANDELATTVEAGALFHGAGIDRESQVWRLPRLLPVAYAAHAAGYELFGRDERGSRVVPALAGTLGIGLLFLLLRGVLGTAAATATALLVTLSPDHLFHSQQNRFYVIAWLFGSLCMLLGARALRSRSPLATGLACAAGVLAVLSHTVLAVLVPALFVGLAAGAWVQRRGGTAPARGIVRPLALVAATGVLVVLVYVLWIRGLLSSWNAGRDTWRYSTPRSLMAAVRSVGWPVALCCVPGAFLAWRRADGQGALWIVFALTWIVSAAVLPSLVAYHGHYVFPMSLGMFVLAGLFVEWVWTTLRSQGRTLAALCALPALTLWSLPGVASNYVDGSRHDYRAAAVHIASLWEPGDRILSDSEGLVGHYAPACRPLVHLPSGDSRRVLEEERRAPGRTWIVIRTERRTIFPPVRAWLDQHARRTLLVSQRRYDDNTYTIEVFLTD